MTYKFKTACRPAQQQEFDTHKDSPKRGLWWQMRTGKSKAVTDCFSYQYQKGTISGVLLLAPNGVHVNWTLKELPKHCPVDCMAHAYQSSKFKTKKHQEAMEALNVSTGALKVLCVNHESIRTEGTQKAIVAFLKAHKKRLMLVVDESHAYRTPGSARTKAIKRLAKEFEWVRLLSGTPAKNTPLALWSQMEIFGKGTLGHATFSSFRQRYAVYKKMYGGGGRSFEKLLRYENLDELMMKMSEHVTVVLRDDAGMPDIIKDKVPFEMKPAQQRAYDKLAEQSMLGDEFYEGGARLIKMQQITRGWYKDEDGQVVSLVADKDNPALLALEQQIEHAPGKVIVWCQFQEDIRMVSELLGYDAVQYHGNTKQALRPGIIDSFTSEDGPRIFIGQPQAAGTGLDLSIATTVIWFSHTHDLILREQASERATAVGGHNVDLVDLCAHNSVDDLILLAHETKTEISELVAGQGLANYLELQEIL